MHAGKGAREIRRGWLTAVLVLTLSYLPACAHYEPRPIEVERALQDLEERRLDAPELTAFVRDRQEEAAWPPERWGLRELSLAAFYYSPALDVARAQWGVAEGGVLTAGGRANPGESVALGYNASTPEGDVSPWIPEAALDLPLDIAGKRGIRIAEARHASRAARLNLLHTAWQVRSEVRRSYLGLYVAQETASLLARRQEILDETIRILEAQLAAGEASPTDVTRARVDAANGRVAALAAEQGRAQAQADLANAIGLPPRALADVTLDFDELGSVRTAIPPDEARRNALLHRSDILGALEDYEASQSALQLEIRRQYPSFSLGPAYQLDQTDSKWTLRLGIVLPLLNRNQGPIAEAAAHREEVGARFMALQSRVLGEVEVATKQARSAARQVAAADTLLDALAQQEATAQVAFDVGEISRLELLGLEAEAVATSLGRLDALARAQTALGALEDAMEIPFDVEPWVIQSPRPANGPREGRR